jgi:hypothetical protein
MQDTRRTTELTSAEVPPGVRAAVDHARRRELLRLLAEPDPPRKVGALARELSERRGCWAGSPEVRDAAVTLHHVHLPKLAAAAVVDYDADARVVTDVDRERARELVAVCDGPPNASPR